VTTAVVVGAAEVLGAVVLGAVVTAVVGLAGVVATPVLPELPQVKTAGPVRDNELVIGSILT
jgi:hypothetical protein